MKWLFVLLIEVDSSQLRRQLCGGSQAAIERMIHFGRELQAMSEQLRRECGKNTANKKMLKVRPLLAFSDNNVGGGVIYAFMFTSLEVSVCPHLPALFLGLSVVRQNLIIPGNSLEQD